MNPDLAVAGILLTMADGRTRLAAEVEAELRRHFGSLVFTTTIPRSVRLAEAPSHGVPAIAYDRALSRRGGLLEGGDGACRAFLRSDVVSGAGLEVLLGEAGQPELVHLPVEIDPSEPAPASPSVRARGGRRARELDPAPGGPPADRGAATRGWRLRAHRWRAALARRAGCWCRDASGARPGRRGSRLPSDRARGERRPRAALSGRGSARLRVTRRRVRALARRCRRAGRPVEVRGIEPAAAARAAGRSAVDARARRHERGPRPRGPVAA